MMNRTFRFTVAALALATSPLAGCDLFEVEDRPSPNGISIEDILANPTEANITNLAVGIEGASRTQLGTYLVDVGVIGREYWRVSPSDPRFTADLLGKGSATLDNNTFYITNPWAARYANVRNANVLLLALEANQTLSADAKAAASGFAKTWKAYQYLLNLNLTYTNGIRFIGQNDAAAGPLVGYDAALDQIAALLDEAAAELGADETGANDDDGADLPFSTTVGADYYTLNRALASRVDLYREDWGGVIGALDQAGAFDGDLEAGAYHVFSTSGGDFANPFYFSPQANGDATLAHPSFVADLRTGDTRAVEGSRARVAHVRRADLVVRRQRVPDAHVAAADHHQRRAGAKPG